ncbi:MAG: hypothetical protein Kow0089_16430 [Desulfobulbaceae bacterium]
MIRYIKTLAGVFLYLFCCVLALAPLLVIRPHIEGLHYGIGVTVWALVSFLCFFPVMAVIVNRVWFFRGKGEPISLERLRAMILDVNTLDAPVSVKEHGERLVVSWRCQDQEWCERIEKTKMKKLYELWLRFDTATRTVTMVDKYRSVDWSLSPVKVKTGWFAFGTPYFGVETGMAWGLENYTDARPEDYEFSPNEIKSPILNTILKHGWNVRFRLM